MTTTKHVLFAFNSLAGTLQRLHCVCLHAARCSSHCCWYFSGLRMVCLVRSISSYLHMVLYMKVDCLVDSLVGTSRSLPSHSCFYSQRNCQMNVVVYVRMRKQQVYIDAQTGGYAISSIHLASAFTLIPRLLNWAGSEWNKAHLSSLKLYKIIFRCRFCSVLMAHRCALNVVFVIWSFSCYNCFTAYVHPFSSSCAHTEKYTYSSFTLVRATVCSISQRKTGKQAKLLYTRLFAYYYHRNTPEMARMYFNSQYCVNYRFDLKLLVYRTQTWNNRRKSLDSLVGFKL